MPEITRKKALEEMTPGELRTEIVLMRAELEHAERTYARLFNLRGAALDEKIKRLREMIANKEAWNA